MRRLELEADPAQAIRIARGENHVGSLGAGVSRRLAPNSPAAADHDYGLPEQFRFALSGRSGACGAHDSSGSVLFREHLRPRFSVRKELRLLALRPGGSLLRAADVPIGTAALQHGAQIET